MIACQTPDPFFQNYESDVSMINTSGSIDSENVKVELPYQSRTRGVSTSTSDVTYQVLQVRTKCGILRGMEKYVCTLSNNYAMMRSFYVVERSRQSLQQRNLTYAISAQSQRQRARGTGHRNLRKNSRARRSTSVWTWTRKGRVQRKIGACI